MISGAAGPVAAGLPTAVPALECDRLEVAR